MGFFHLRCEVEFVHPPHFLTNLDRQLFFLPNVNGKPSFFPPNHQSKPNPNEGSGWTPSAGVSFFSEVEGFPFYPPPNQSNQESNQTKKDQPEGGSGGRGAGWGRVGCLDRLERRCPARPLRGPGPCRGVPGMVLARQGLPAGRHRVQELRASERGIELRCWILDLIWVFRDIRVPGCLIFSEV